MHTNYHSEALRIVADICSRHNLNWSPACETAQAALHGVETSDGGPLKIMLPRADCRVLVSELAKNTPEPFVVSSLMTSATYDVPYPTISVEGTTLMHIYPVDALANSFQHSVALANKVFFVGSLYRARVRGTVEGDSAWRRMRTIVCRTAMLPMSPRSLAELVDKKAASIGTKGARFCSVLVEGSNLGAIISTDAFDGKNKVTYLGVQCPIIQGIEDYIERLKK